MIRKLLVGVDSSTHSRSVQSYAFSLARRFHAAVIGLHVVDIVSIEGSYLHDISGSLGLEPYLDFSSKMREVLTARGKSVLDEFAMAAAREGIEVETQLDMGIVPNQISDRARNADLVLIGNRGVNEKFSTGLLGHTAEAVARRCPRPLFIAPPEYRDIERPVLAYDGSDRAAKAMHAAAEICVELNAPLTILTVARDPKLGHKILDEARKYVDTYEIRTEFQHMGGYAPEGIVNFLRGTHADLVFIGAYGHSRIVEMVLGSTTEYVLRNAPCPVFLAR
ncbi:MAG TPA: universal stress protein [Candidatus Binataceae bacterium]